MPTTPNDKNQKKRPSNDKGRQRRPWGRRWILALINGLILGAAAAAPWADGLHRLGIDFLLPVRHALFGPLYPAADSETVIVSIDEETYRTPPFSETPRVAWTPMLANVVDAIDKAGARTIGFDLIYPTSLDRPDLLAGYDKPLLKVLYKAGRAGRLVLGKVRLSQQSIVPYKGQQAAVGGPANIRPLNLLLDADNVVRRHPASFPSETGGRTPSFAVELATRAGGAGIVPKDDFLINFNTGPNDIPTYSLADLHACVENGGADFFKRYFADKIVIVGASLDVEDRRFPAKRFALGGAQGGAQSKPPERCRIPFDQKRFGQTVVRRSVPGALIHAAAVNTLMRNNALTLQGRAGTFAVTAASATLLTIIFFFLAPASGALAALGILGIEGGIAAIAFRYGSVAPVITLGLEAVFVFTVVYAFRFVVEDRNKRRIKHAFGHYLSPALVERLSESTEGLRLGGEHRWVTIMFSDIAGYTTLSESMRDKPEQLVDILNRYFTVLTGVIENRQGYVASFMGDAIMAFWGAPVRDDDAEKNAVRAALGALDALDAFNRDVVEGECGLEAIGTRIGIHTGSAVLGNTGSASRLNYTATGDTTNLAARLEGANKLYGTRLMISAETARGLDETFILRALDRLVVKGRSEPVDVFEVAGTRDRVNDDTLARIADFEAALEKYYERRFQAAQEVFERLAVDDRAAEVYVERCINYASEPPPDDWDGSFVAQSK